MTRRVQSVLAGIVSHGRSAQRLDDFNAIVTYECCGRSAAFSREDGQAITNADMGELMGGTDCGCGDK